MSGFFGSSEPTRWGGLLKQAISNVETTFDTLLEQNANNLADPDQLRSSSTDDFTIETETETYMDPISGMVTTIQKPKKKRRPPNDTKTIPPLPSQAKPPVAPIPVRQNSDLSARLAAVMAEKSRKPLSRSSSVSSHSTEPPLTQKPVVDTPDEKHIDTSITVENNADIDNDQAEKELVDDGLKGEPENDIEKSFVSDEVEPDNTDVNQEKNNDSSLEQTNKDLEDINHNEKTTPSTTVITVKQETSECLERDLSTNTTKEESVDSKMEELKKDDDNQAAKDKSKDISKNSLDENSRILQQRENQLLQAMETITKLHDQLHSEQQDTERYAVENQNAQAEIQKLQSQLAKAQQTSKNTLSSSDQKNIKKLENSIEELKQQLATKDEQVQGLMREGEKLSKNELKHNTMIKKLRNEKSEVSKSISELQKKLEKTTSELVEANAKILKNTELEKRSQESIKVLSDMTEQQTKHINKLESDAIALKEQDSQTQIALKAALGNLEDERTKAKIESEEAYAAVLEKEVKANDRLHKELTKSKEDAQSMESKLRKEIRDLQITLQTIEERAGTREDFLQNEILAS
ncbi:hypothetical protein DFQ28_002421 [Apophysomyces sp. BC1034]|nr:hypothetical protein DFQ29_001806 [Apophysomyces sp. BC1021]KAG0190171.1 hypothetical protein DFQ28_002421 [Apophysomyces sp. BC1034]